MERYKYSILETCQSLSMGLSGASDLPPHHYELYKWLNYRLDNWEETECKSVKMYSIAVRNLILETLRLYEDSFGED